MTSSPKIIVQGSGDNVILTQCTLNFLAFLAIGSFIHNCFEVSFDLVIAFIIISYRSNQHS